MHRRPACDRAATLLFRAVEETWMGHINALVAFTFLTVSKAMATTGAPTTQPSPNSTTGPGGGDGGLTEYWWIVLIVLVAAAAFWYFARRSNRTV